MKIGILGHFGIGHNLLNGQTVKTKNLSDAFEKYTDIEIVKIDSHGWIKNPFKLFFNIKSAFKECDGIIMLPAQNGVKVFSPVLLHYKKKYGKKLFYDVIGGWLPEFLSDKPNLTKTLKGFDGIWTETNVMKKKLEKLGLSNVTAIPNFKELTPLDKSELKYSDEKPLKLCTFSRVMKEKGIGTAVDAVKKINEQLGYTAFSLDIYGQVDSNQTEWFDQLKATFPDYIAYKGMAPSDKSVEILKDYFCLVFPTFYNGEGFAGTLIDAYSAGIPVIASDWRYNREIVSKNTGYVYKTDNTSEFEDILKKVADNPSLILDKKSACIDMANNYKAEVVIKTIVKRIVG